MTFDISMVIFLRCKTNIFEREWTVFGVILSSKELHHYSLPGKCAICGQWEVTVNVEKTSTSVPQRCARQQEDTGRLEHLCLPDCQRIYTQHNNLHQECTVPMTRRSRGGGYYHGEEKPFLYRFTWPSSIYRMFSWKPSTGEWNSDNVFSPLPAVTFPSQPGFRTLSDCNLSLN